MKESRIWLPLDIELKHVLAPGVNVNLKEGTLGSSKFGSGEERTNHAIV